MLLEAENVLRVVASDDHCQFHSRVAFVRSFLPPVAPQEHYSSELLLAMTHFPRLVAKGARKLGEVQKGQRAMVVTGRVRAAWEMQISSVGAGWSYRFKSMRTTFGYNSKDRSRPHIEGLRLKESSSSIWASESIDVDNI